jgi:iron complex transport system ATP-binding protein
VNLQTYALSVGYRTQRGAVLERLDLAARPGEFICVLGRNGAGKSTLMRTIAGLQAPLEGRAELGGECIARLSAPARARRIAVVLTERVSSPGLTVDDVVALGRQPFTDWRGRLSAADAERARQAISVAGAGHLTGRLLDDLSDGERQRVMIARAIAQEPQLMVLDEITAFLDLPGRVEVMSLLRRHARATGTAVLLSSHDLDLSLQLADTVWLIDDGRLRVGPPAALAADGSIGHAFDADEIVFSRDRGRFELRMPA